MKNIFLLTIIGLLYACNGSSQNTGGKDSAGMMNESGQSAIIDSSQNMPDTTLEGKWVLQPVLASDTAAGKVPAINFNLGAGTFNGNTGCNSMSGAFIKKANSLAFSEQLMSTKMACQGYNEKAFLDNLFLTNNYKIENGVLMLMNNQTVLSKWTRKLQPVKLQKA